MICKSTIRRRLYSRIISIQRNFTLRGVQNKTQHLNFSNAYKLSIEIMRVTEKSKQKVKK